MELAELIQLLQRRRGTLLRCLLLVPIATWLVMAVLPAEYAATAMIGVGRPAWQAPDLAGRGNDSGRGDVHTQETLVTTPSVLAATIDRLQLTAGTLDTANCNGLLYRLIRWWRPLADPGTALAVSDLKGRVTVKSVLNTSLVGVTVQWPDPDVAQQIANAVAETYSQHNQLEDAREATTTRRYLEVQAGREGQALAKAEAEMSVFRRQAGPLLTGDPTATGHRVDEIQQQVREAQAAQAEASARQSALQGALAARDRQMAQSLDPTQSRERDPYYSQLRTRLSEASAEARSFGAKAGTLANALGQERSQLARLPELERRLAGLSREATLHREAFQNLQTQLTQVRLAEAAKIGTARLVESATRPLGPAYPKKGQNTSLAIIAGLLMGLLWGALQEFSDPAFRSAEDAGEQLDLPLLGTVPTLAPVKPVRQTGVALLPAASSLAMARWQDPSDDAAEAFRLLRAGLRSLKPPTTVVVISPGVGEGKTTVCVNLAIGLAQIGRKVLLIDADLRRPAIHRHLEVPVTPGLSDLLQTPISDAARFDDLVAACTHRPAATPGLSVIAGGSRTRQAGDLLKSPRLGLLIAAQRSQYDVIIVDGPPALAYADAVALGSLADGVIIVVDPRRTPRRAAQQVVAMLRHARIPILGLVANRTTSPDKPSYSRYQTVADPATGPAEVSR